MDRLNEPAFENAIEAKLLDSGYQRDDPADFERTLALQPKHIVDFIRATQPDEWKRLESIHGAAVCERVVTHVAQQLDKRGTLDVLRNGLADRGVHYRLAFFRPASGRNPEAIRRYAANRLSVMRQVRYCLDDERSVDIVLFVNGIPVATAELKNAFTGQTTVNAIRQYLQDRIPTVRTPLIQPRRRALVHFAVDTDEVFMTTRLAGADTFFLPFNRGDHEGRGNPENPGGYRTEYLWDEVWQRDNWLDILHRFIQIEHHEESDNKSGRRRRSERIIFPRYHQWDAVRQMLRQTLSQRVGTNYLIQHSAGSGKTHSISWLAHQLASLHDAADNPVFAAVIVVSDRRNLDRQLQDNIHQFEQKRGVVELIQPSSGQSKSDALSAALSRGARIIVTTLQTFSHVLEKVGDLSDRNFAVIADEAHSSQTGKAAGSLRIALGSAQNDEALLDAAERAEERDACEEDDTEAEILRYIKARGPQRNLSFYAFTATPKKRTLEMFGIPGADGQPQPAHRYSMRQAIEEGFIHDVLKHYTTYRSYYELSKRIEGDPLFDSGTARKAVARFATLHGHVLAQKTEVMIEHFRRFVRHKINGQAKAMVVTRSRLHAVRYKQAFDAYIREKGYTDIQALVAFSQTVVDPKTEAEYTEEKMNGFPEAELPERFDSDDYQILLVAEKYQTGFDQPKLHTIYVDKPLMDLAAVQTLSRINRTCPGKTDTCVIDFVNEWEDIRAAFTPYYQLTEIDRPTDPNQIYQLRDKIMAYAIAWPQDVEAFAKVFFRAPSQQSRRDRSLLNQAVDPAVHRYKVKFRVANSPAGSPVYSEDGDEFKGYLTSFARFYSFVAQLYDLADVGLEKLYAYFQALATKLPKRNGDEVIDLDGEVELLKYRQERTFEGDASLTQVESRPVYGSVDLGNRQHDDKPLSLSEIILGFNERFGTIFSREDVLYIEQVEGDLLKNTPLCDQARDNSLENFRSAFEDELTGTFLDRQDRNAEILDRIMSDDELRRSVFEVMLDSFYRQARNSKP